MANNAAAKNRHDDLIRALVEKYIPAFAPGATVLYTRDRSENQASFDDTAFGGLGISDLKLDRVPDVIIYHTAKNRLFLVDTVPGHGPINTKRHNELTHLFKGAQPYLVFVTAFLSRSEMARCVGEISWATDVWSADAESHLIHFNGERFLGPYDDVE